MRLVLPAVALALAVGVLVRMVIVRETIRCLGLQDLKAQPEGQVCRLDGLIDSIEQLAGPLRFTLRSATDRSLKLRVESRASTPDNFKPGITVSVRGRHDPKDNLYLADNVTTAPFVGTKVAYLGLEVK